MKELLDKLSSYNIFNYLLPGILFSVLASKTTELNLIQIDIILGVFVYYFIGLIISRIGSLIIEPILKLDCDLIITADHALAHGLYDFDHALDVFIATRGDFRVEP